MGVREFGSITLRLWSQFFSLVAMTPYSLRLPSRCPPEGIRPVGPTASRSTSTSRPALARLDRRRRRLRGPADQGRHRLPAPRRHARAGTRGSTGSAATRSSATSRPGTLTSRAVQGHAPVGQLPRRRRAVAETRASSWCARTPARSSSAPPASRRRTCAASSSICSQHKGKEIFIRLVDQAHRPLGPHQLRRLPLPRAEAERAAAAEAEPPPPPDVYKYAGLPPEKAAAGDDRARRLQGHALRRRAGRACSRSPCAIDDRGRLWVAEAYSLSRIAPQADKDAKRPHPDLRGHRRRRQVRQAHRLHRRPEPRQRPRGRLRRRLGRRGPVLAVHPRSTTATTSPPARRRSCSTAGATRTRTRRSTPSPGARTAGSTAATASSRTRSVGKPGTPDKDRIPINAGIWRYHPTRHVFEVFAHGTSNPWGLDFNDHGQVFVEACVIPHCFHIIQGGRYQRQAGHALQPVHLRRHQDDRRPPPLRRRQPARRQRPLRQRRRRPRPLRPDDLPRRRLARRSTAASSSWATSTATGSTWTCSKPKGSGYVATHGPDFLLANDAWSPLHQPDVRPRRQRLPDRLVRQASLPHRRRRRSGTAPTAASTRSATAARSRSTGSIWRSAPTRNW